MPAFVVLADDGTEIGSASLYDGRLDASGVAEQMIGGRVHAGETESDAFGFFAGGWSNGYISTAPYAAASAAPVALLDRAKACRAALVRNTRLLAGTPVVAEFTELKVRRDRKGRFAKKNSGEILAELDDIVARLGALKGSIRNEDHQSEVDDALDRLTTVRDEHKVQAVRTEVGLDTVWEGEVRFNAAPGTVEVDHDRETWDLTPGEAEQLAKALDDLAAVEVPKRPDRNAPVEALDRVEIDADSGSFFAERLDDGSFEVGSIDDDGNDVEGLRLNGPVEAEEFADLLEEMAEKASRREDDPIWGVPGKAKDTSRTVPSGTYEHLEVTANRDGTVTFGFDGNGITRPAADVRKVSDALSQLRTVPVPTGDNYTTGEAGRVEIAPDFAVVKWNTGQYEIGDPAEFDPDESGPSVLLLDGDDEASALADVLDELSGGVTAGVGNSTARRLSAKFDPNQPRDGEGKWTDGPGVSLAAADKLKLGKKAPAGTTVRSSKKITTDNADFAIAEVDGPDGPQVRVGLLTAESGRWDAGFSGETRKAELRRQIAEKNAQLENSDPDADTTGLEDEIGELSTELDDLNEERTAVVHPAVMKDFGRQLDTLAELAKANKAKQDATMKQLNAVEEQRDDIIAEHSDADMERKLAREASLARGRRDTIKRLKNDPDTRGWGAEKIAELIELHEGELAKHEANLAPLLARRRELMPPDALARLEDLDRQVFALTEGDIDDILGTATVSTPQGGRVRAEVWGSDDEESDWVSARLYVINPGETDEDAEMGDAYAWFRGLRGLNKLRSGLEVSDAP